MARDPNRPNPDESVTRQEPVERPQSDQQRPEPNPGNDTGFSSERAPRRDNDIETDRGDGGRRNEGIE